MIILSGPSGAGKTTLHDRLLRSSEYSRKIARSISATTRPPRPGEVEGKDYFFISCKMFEYRIRAGQFLEWAKVFDNYYGTPTKYVRDQLRAGRSVILCIDVQGASQVRRSMPEALSIFIKTPTVEDLRVRLEGRKSDHPEAVALRLKTAVEELKQAKHYDYVLINDRLERAFVELCAVLDQEGI